MANPWDGATYENGNSGPGIGNGEIACATKKGTREIYWRHDTGARNWTAAPVAAGVVPEGKSKICHTHLLPDGSVIVTNGIDWTRRSTEYGKAGSWKDY